MISIASSSYLIAALAFFLLAVLLLTSWRGRAHGVSLTVACAISALSSVVLAMGWGAGTAWSGAFEAMEIARSGAWTLFLVLLVGPLRVEDSRLPFGIRPAVVTVLALYLLLVVASCAGALSLTHDADSGLTLRLAVRVGLAVLGMLLVEQLYRNKPDNERWAIKFACLGIGAMFAYDFYMYSDAMLFHKINAEIWAARGVANALTVPLIALSVARSASWSSELAVSRRVMFHSAALFGSALYLLAMGSAGYYLKYFGGSWGSVMQVIFLFGAIALLVGVLFSGSFRAWLRVFISKHFYSYNYDYREEWLRFTATLSKPGPGLGDRAVQAIATLVESPSGLMWTRGDTDQFEPAATWHTGASSICEPVDSAFCLYMQEKKWVIDLEELAADPAKYDNAVLPAWLLQFPRGWLVVPLMLHERLFGFIVLTQPRSRIALNWEVIDLLKIAGSQAASYLAQNQASNALMVARQFESFNRMSTFVVHDLKNLVLQLSLLLSNAEKHKHNPAFQEDMLETIDYSVQKMKLLLQKLSRSVTPERARALSVEAVVRQAMALKAAFDPHPVLTVSDPGLMVLADGERLERVVGHLIQNAIEATSKDGRVDIEVLRNGQAAIVRIHDTGEGMTADFIRERLFKPFESTKSAGMGIGVFESQEYIQELGGALDVSSVPQQGSIFTITLPLLDNDAGAVQQQAA